MTDHARRDADEIRRLEAVVARRRSKLDAETDEPLRQRRAERLRRAEYGLARFRELAAGRARA